MLNHSRYEQEALASSAEHASPDASWIVAVRTCLLSIALLSLSICSFYYGPETARNVRSLYLPVALLFGFSGLCAMWLRRYRGGDGFVFLQLIADIIILTGLMYATGGPASPFLFLYLPLVMGAAVFISRGVALVAAGLSGAAYASLVWLMVNRYLAPFDGSSVVHTPAGGFLLQSVGLMSAMILIAVTTSFLTRKVLSGYMLAEQSKRVLSHLTQEQRRLFDTVPEGIISTDMTGRVVAVNDSARRLLHLGNEVMNRELRELITSSNASCDLGQPVEDDQEIDVTLCHVEGGEEVHLRYFRKPAFDHHEEQTGWIYIFNDVTRLRSVEEQLAMQERMARLLAGDSSEVLPASSAVKNFVGESTVMRKVFGLIERIAPSDATVLISGESGTGKELVARAIHLGGPRSIKPFMPINCGAIPETLIESELFGHKKGSFTGADSDKTGLFRQADGGTIFLDEIGELPLLTQAKLLRVLQEKCVRPVGSESALPVNVRIIAATNRNLRDEVKEQRFREDLFYRLNVIHVQLPALRDRKEDVPLLVNSILRRLVEGEPPAVSPEVMRELMEYDYPGNVRELENILERAIVFGSGVILPEHLPEYVRSAERESVAGKSGETVIIELDNMNFPMKLDDFLAEIERNCLETALVRSDGVKKRAAELLGINFRSFRYRLQKFDIEKME